MTSAPPPLLPPTPARGVRLPSAVGGCLKKAAMLSAAGGHERAVDWLAAAAVCDIQQHQLTFLAGAAESGFIADRYAECFGALGLGSRPSDFAGARDRPARTPRGRPLRLAYITASIVEGQAASHRLARMVAQHDRSRFEPIVIVAEEFTARTPPVQAVSWPDRPSMGVGGEPLRQLVSAGVPIHVVSTRGSYIDGAREAIALVRSLSIDVAVFIASPACPIQAAMAFARVAPVQINQNIGAPLLVGGAGGGRGIDAVIYHNRATAEADAEELGRRGIGLFVVPSVGTDIAAAAGARPVERAELGVPSGAVVLASASNKLPERMMHGTFARDLAAFLARHGRVWWVGIGRGDYARVLGVLGEAGVGGRVRLTGPARDVRPIVKACDVFLNEYPEGGCNTVLEAMACALPVAAMVGGRAHTESVGAELVGPELALRHGDAAGYWGLVERWATDPAARRADGESLRERATAEFDSARLCGRYEECYCAAVTRAETG